MKFRETIKGESSLLILIFLSSITPFFAFEKKIISFILFLTLNIGGFILLSKKHIMIENIKNKNAFLYFIHSLFTFVQFGQPLSYAYDKSTIYLIGYQNIIAYEDWLSNNNSYQSNKYDSFLARIKENEVNSFIHIENYMPLLKNIENEIETLVTKLYYERKLLSLFCVTLIAELFLCYMINISSTLKAVIASPFIVFLIATILILLCFSPILLAIKIYKEQ